MVFGVFHHRFAEKCRDAIWCNARIAQHGQGNKSDGADGQDDEVDNYAKENQDDGRVVTNRGARGVES